MRGAGPGLPLAEQPFRHRGSLLFVALLIGGPGIARAADECGPSTTPLRGSASPARANDNRIAAGSMRAGVVEARLVARAASWSPDGPKGCALAVHAFAEEGKSPSIPGPLLRVPFGG